MSEPNDERPTAESGDVTIPGMGLYTATVGQMSIAVRSLQDAQAVVMEGVTGLVSLDPEAASQGALMANRAFASGTVEQVLKSHGVWRTVVSARGERIEISIARRSWWRRAVRASG